MKLAFIIFLPLIFIISCVSSGPGITLESDLFSEFKLIEAQDLLHSSLFVYSFEDTFVRIVKIDVFDDASANLLIKEGKIQIEASYSTSVAKD